VKAIRGFSPKDNKFGLKPAPDINLFNGINAVAIEITLHSPSLPLRTNEGEFFCTPMNPKLPSHFILCCFEYKSPKYYLSLSVKSDAHHSEMRVSERDPVLKSER
jgi:hypothetical protein